MPGDAESIDSAFPESSFDLVVAHNSLDHGHDPLQAFRACLHVVRPSCWLAIWQVENEGEKEGYRELHQWNFSARGNEFLAWNRSIRYENVLGSLPEADLLLLERQNHHDTDWLHVRIRRKR
jgi:SAM-dependent methyltransferase